MPEYKVNLRRSVDQFATVYVEADDEEAAEEKAKEYESEVGDIDWDEPEGDGEYDVLDVKEVPAESEEEEEEE